MRVYVDSSALIKRAVDEPESDALDAALDRHVREGDVLASSSLAWIEVSRAVTALLHGSGEATDVINDTIAVALAGVAEQPIGDNVVALARRIGPPVLRSLDAIHVASAVLLDADLVLTYDDRMADACRRSGLLTAAPE